MYDFIVIGAGIAGASLACELAQSSRVCVLEREDRAGVHSTGRSAALFAPSYGGSQIRALTRSSRHFFDHPPAGFCDHPLLTPRGCLYIARSDQRDRLDCMTADLRETGAQVTPLNIAQTFGLVPLLREGYVVDAVLDPEAMDIDVNALHQGFLRSARAAGAALLTGTRILRSETRDGLWHIELTDRTVTAAVVVNAAGAWADEVATSLGARPVGLEPRRRTALVVDPPPGVDVRRWPAVIDADEEFYFKPEAGKLLLSPADETPVRAGDVQPEELDVALGIHRVECALDIDVRRVAHSWAGLRTFAADRVPVVGFDPEVPNFFWCAGQGGYGIQTAPALARGAACLARRESLPVEVLEEGVCPEDLSPGRFLTGKQ